MTLVAVEDPIQAEVILTPGAKISTHDPYDEVDETLSLLAEEATVKVFGAPAGELWQASALPLGPAATINGMLAL